MYQQGPALNRYSMAYDIVYFCLGTLCPFTRRLQAQKKCHSFIQFKRREETQSETAIKQVPEAVPTVEIGNTVVPKGNMPGSHQIPVIPVTVGELLPSPASLPYEMEDSADNW